MRAMRWLTLLILLSCLLAMAAWFTVDYRVGKPGPLSETKIIVIEPGASTRQIAKILADESIIYDRYTFLSYLYTRHAHNALKAGEYKFAPTISGKSVIEKLSNGEVVIHSITIPEGFTSMQAMELLNKTTNLSGVIAETPEEGTLLPETYNFTRGDNRNDMLDRMRTAQSTLLEELWKNRKSGLPISTPKEAVILASIGEKETGLRDERGRVAAVFINRLRKKMRLQSDPTVMYGITEGKTLFERAITGTDLRTPTAYNTYTIFGLPPGPIANPGKATLKAVLNPPDTQDLYFVTDGNGGHRFGKTLKEHNQNIRQWKTDRTRVQSPDAKLPGTDAEDEEQTTTESSH